MRRGADVSAALFVWCALANALGIAGLARVFGYPGVLNTPAAATLADLGARERTLIPCVLLTATAAFLLVPLTARIVRARPELDGTRRSRWLLLCTSLATSIVLIFGWSLWLVGVPLLAHPPGVTGRLDPNVITFDLLRVVAGVLCGETLGPLLLAGWTTLVATRFVAVVLDGWWPFGPLRPVGRAMPHRDGAFGRFVAVAGAWTDWLRLRGLLWSRPALVGGGVGCAVLLVAGAASTVGLLPAAPLPVLARMVWSLWLAGVGVAVWTSRTQFPVALGALPRVTGRAGGARAGRRPQPAERLPYRYDAYHQAIRQNAERLRAAEWRSGHPTAATAGDDAVTVAGDEVILDGARRNPAPAPPPPSPSSTSTGLSGSSKSPAGEELDPPTEIVSSPPGPEPPGAGTSER